MASIDLNQLKAKIRLIEVLDLLGMRDHGLQAKLQRGPCPLRCSDDPRCCYYDWSKDLWYCHRCRNGDGAMGLYATVHRCSVPEAALKICHRLGIKVPWKERSKVRQPRRPRNRRNFLADGEQSPVD